MATQILHGIVAKENGERRMYVLGDGRRHGHLDESARLQSLQGTRKDLQLGVVITVTRQSFYTEAHEANGDEALVHSKLKLQVRYLT